MNKTEREKLRELAGRRKWEFHEVAAAPDAINSLLDHIDALEDGLQEIFDFTNGYGDIAGIVNRMAHKILSPDVFEAIASAQEN